MAYVRVAEIGVTGVSRCNGCGNDHPHKREALTRTIDAYAEDFPEDFFWATGSQAPMLLHHLFNTIDSVCRPEAQSKPRPAIRLVDRKPEGNA